MFCHTKTLLRLVLLAVMLCILDYIVCFHTYYIPDLQLFLSYKYRRETVDNELKPSLFNFYGNQLLETRFAKTSNDSIDWFELRPPSETGCAFIINTNNREFNLANSPFSPLGDYYVIDYHVNYFNISHTAIDPDSLCVGNKVRKPFIIIENYHWLLDRGVCSIPEQKLIKAHIWHLLFR